MNDDFDARLRDRMRRLEETMPDLTTTTSEHRRLRWSLPAVTLIAALAFAAGAAGATVMREAVGTAPGVFSPDGPLYCTRIQQLSPREADPLLREFGYDVTWQVENRDTGDYERSTTPPSEGYIVEGALIGRDLVLVVEQGSEVEQVSDPCPFGG